MAGKEANMPFKFIPLNIPDIILIEPEISQDKRGFFMETFKFSDFAEHNIRIDFTQENYSKSKKRTLRGLHYQLLPRAQGKLIKVIKGAILDIAVDIRKKSPYFGRYTKILLSEKNKLIIWIPIGFAHGFYALKNSEILYKTTFEYSPYYERGIIWDDPEINIDWPDKKPLISAKDLLWPTLNQAENNFFWRQ